MKTMFGLFVFGTDVHNGLREKQEWHDTYSKIKFAHSTSLAFVGTIYAQLSAKYEDEQRELAKKILEAKDRLIKLDGLQYTGERFTTAVRNFMQISELTPKILHELVDRIEVYAAEGTGENRTQRIVIHYRFIGDFDIPKLREDQSLSTVRLNTRKGVSVEYLPNKDA